MSPSAAARFQLSYNLVDMTGLLSSGLLNFMVCVCGVVICTKGVGTGAGGMLRRCILLIYAGQRVATPERQALDSSGVHSFQGRGLDDRSLIDVPHHEGERLLSYRRTPVTTTGTTMRRNELGGGERGHSLLRFRREPAAR